jgi:hypothetical protein
MSLKASEPFSTAKVGTFGASNEGQPTGVAEAEADHLQRDFAALSNNPTKLKPL